MSNAPKIKPGPITSLPQDIVRWVQSRLAIGGYYKGAIDGIAGHKTIAALSRFKEDYFLEHPLMVGLTTLEALSELGEPDSVSEQTKEPTQQPNPDAGQKRGKRVKLPVVGEVFEHEWIIVDGFLTWGEMTKSLTRLPVATDQYSQIELVKNAIAFARAYRLIREKFGSPIQITSGYRPPAVNRSIGGASRSQHLNFLAADIAPLNGKWDYLLACIKSVPEIKGIGIAGARKGFWHIDCRRGSRVIFPYK